MVAPQALAHDLTSWRPRLAATVLAVALCLGAPFPAAGEEAFDPHEAHPSFGVRDTRAARFALEKARTALRNGEVLVGLRAAQRVLDNMRNDFFLHPQRSRPESILWRSAAEVAREILAGLTEPQREAYEDLVRMTAEPLIRMGVARRKPALLEEALRRYGASTAGLRAARLLTELSMESGRWRDGARYALEGLRYAPTDAALWRRALQSLAAGGDRRALATLTFPDPDFEIEMNGVRASLSKHRVALLAQTEARAATEGWPMWGGAPSRARNQTAAPPVATRLRWESGLSTAVRELDGPTIRRSNNARRFAAMVPEIDPVHAVAVQRTVYVSDGLSVRAIDMFTGRLLWRFHDRNAPPGLLFSDRGELPGRSSLERAYAPVVTDRTVVATIELNQPATDERLNSVVIETTIQRRGVFALNREGGHYKWHRFGPLDAEFPVASVVSPPVVAEGLVIALVSEYAFNHNLSFVALDLETGAVRWKRALGFGQQELNLFGYPTKELAGSAVAAVDGVAYASSGLGFVAAVDIRSGIPRWLASYEPVEILPVEIWYEAPVRIPAAAASPPMVAGDTLIVAPTDSHYIYAYDRHTGAFLWRRRHQRQNMATRTLAHVIGIANDGKRDVVLVTDHALRALSLTTGKVVWMGRFMPENAPVRGRGVVAGGTALIPTRAGLQQFSVRGEGKFLGRHPWPGGATPGNLLATERALLVAARRRLMVFYDWDNIQANAERRLQAHPNDPSALLEAGELYWKGRQVQRALQAFERALPLARQAGPRAVRRANEGLMHTWLTTSELADGTPEALRAARKALQYATTPEHKVRVHVAIHNLGALDLATRIDNLKTLTEVAGTVVAPLEPDARQVPVAAASRILLATLYQADGRAADAVDVLQAGIEAGITDVVDGMPYNERATALIDKILEDAGRAPYARHDERARALLKAAQGMDALEVLNELLARYPNASVVPDALARRAAQRLQAGQAREGAADLLALYDRARGTPEDEARTLARLVRAWRAAGAQGAAFYAAQALRTQHADTAFSIDDEETTGQAFADRVAPADDSNAPVPLRPPLREVLAEPAGDEQALRVLPQRDDVHAGSAPLRLVSRIGENVMAFDLARRTLAWQFADTSPTAAGWSPFGIITTSRSGNRPMRCHDPATGEVRWKVELERDVSDLAIANGQAFVLSRNRATQTFHLGAYDVASGERIWHRTLGRSTHWRLGAWGARVYVQRRLTGVSRHADQVRIFDGVRGASVASFDLGPRSQRTMALFDGKIACGTYAGARKGGEVSVYEVATGKRLFRVPLAGTHLCVALVPAPGEDLLIVRSNGDVLTVDADTGEQRHKTRIFTGDQRVRPFASTTPIADEKRLMIVPYSRSERRLAAYDRTTGKLLWDAPLSGRQRASRITTGLVGDLAWILASSSARRASTHQVLVIDRTTGKRVQFFEPVGLSDTGVAPEVSAGHGALFVGGRKGVVILAGD